RYATAQELADDLGRFLEDKPIRAKRPSLWQRAAKWARRHKTVVRAALVVLVLAGGGLAGSTPLIWDGEGKPGEGLHSQGRNARARAENLLLPAHRPGGARMVGEQPEPDGAIARRLPRRTARLGMVLS